MKVVIDAANIDTGGAFKQLVGFARFVAEAGHEVELCCIRRASYDSALAGSTVRVSSPGLLGRAEVWTRRGTNSLIELGRLLLTSRWREMQLPSFLKLVGADVLFNPNALLPSRTTAGIASVVMSQNMLPFDAKARRLMRPFPDQMKLAMIRRSQVSGMGQADGVVFISEYAARCIPVQVPDLRGATNVNHLGVDDTIFFPHKGAAPTNEPKRIVYVSGLLPYKHHFEVVTALAEVRRHYQGSLELMLVGSDWNGAAARLTKLATRLGVSEWMKFCGALPEKNVAITMREADIGLFASSCENCPTTLIEKMKSGLAIAASNLGPMPEILGDAGLYFDPRQPEQIADLLLRLLLRPDLRMKLQVKAVERAKAFGCDKHNLALLRFLRSVAKPMHYLEK